MTLPSFQICESCPLSCRDHWVGAKGKGAFRIHHQMPAISVHFSASFEWALIGIVVQIWFSQHTPQKWSWIFNLFKPIRYWGKCLNNQNISQASLSKSLLDYLQKLEPSALFSEAPDGPLMAGPFLSAFERGPCLSAFERGNSTHC